MTSIQVTSNKSVDFPKIGWGINAGEVRDLPEGKEAQELILAHNAISKVTGSRARDDDSNTNQD